MVKTQKTAGFGVVEIILIVVIIGLVGFIGYYAYQQQTNPANAPAAVSQNTPADATASWKTHARYGVTYKYPADWQIKENNTTQSMATYLSSPSLVADPTKGDSVTVDITDFNQTGLTAENFKTKHLDANPNDYRDYRELTINGKKAVQFYRGDARTTVFFLPNDVYVTFSLDTFPDRAAASADYDRIIGTVVY